jgi:hypothetical protein
LVTTVPKARRPTAQPKDSGPRDGVNNPKTRPNVLATHPVMFTDRRDNDADCRDIQGLMRIEQSGSASRLKMARGCRETFMWVMGIETIPSSGNIWIRWHYSPVAIGGDLFFRLGSSIGILSLHRITQRRLSKPLAMSSLVGFVSVCEGRVKMGSGTSYQPRRFLIVISPKAWTFHLSNRHQHCFWVKWLDKRD